MRLLLVENEPDLLRGLARTLREEGYAVDTAEDGATGFYKATNAEYDGIVLDAMLPELDGWELLRRLRVTHRTPVLMLTARDSTGDRVRGLDLGADDYLEKPFDLPELLARVRAPGRAPSRVIATSASPPRNAWTSPRSSTRCRVPQKTLPQRAAGASRRTRERLVLRCRGGSLFSESEEVPPPMPCASLVSGASH